ncbi:MAG: cation transporter [Nitrospirae bacterium]|jgi:cation diffusion facilitator family transporter|nr:cation transporter [Nitrospirota bacterium]
MDKSRIITNYHQKVRNVLLYTLIFNTAVASAKIIYGYITCSIAMLSDGYHSLFDGVSNIIGIIGIWIASNPPDKEHPYGHNKYETLFTIAIGIMIFFTCFQIVKKVYDSFFDTHKVIVTNISFTIMLLTLVVNIIVMSYESRKGKQLGSEFLIADANHTKSDILVSLSVIISLFLTRAGYSYADAVAGIILVFLIARIGFKIIKEASDVLVDKICMDTSAVESVVNNIEGVKGCHDIRTRGSSSYTYLDLHVLVDGEMSTEKSHNIADKVEKKIKDEFSNVVDIVVHIEPVLHDKTKQNK